LYPTDEGRTVLHSESICLPIQTASHPRRQ
jgi:hypothetical protein